MDFFFFCLLCVFIFVNSIYVVTPHRGLSTFLFFSTCVIFVSTKPFLKKKSFSSYKCSLKLRESLRFFYFIDWIPTYSWIITRDVGKFTYKSILKFSRTRWSKQLQNRKKTRKRGSLLRVSQNFQGIFLRYVLFFWRRWLVIA